VMLVAYSHGAIISANYLGISLYTHTRIRARAHTHTLSLRPQTGIFGLLRVLEGTCRRLETWLQVGGYRGRRSERSRRGYRGVVP
jgi:hypothetical protein